MTGKQAMTTRPPSSSLHVLNRIAGFGSWIGGIGLLLSSLFIAVDLICRKFFGWSIGGADEIAGYVLAGVSAWAFPIALLRRSHIRVDVLYVHAPRTLRTALDLFALACLAVFVGLLTYQAWLVLEDSISYQAISNTPLQIPLWIPQSIWFAGYVFFIATILCLFTISLALLIRKRTDEVGRLIGINSVEEEIREEVKPAPNEPATHTATGLKA
ncbi:MAG: TRAP transporter small permease [Castellaniella sp.]|uniref:TRAP transporter small permease subunit n=1 Tax=Castellaniella sp. TaxID=1955812 RepID=UPI003C720666